MDGPDHGRKLRVCVCMCDTSGTMTTFRISEECAYTIHSSTSSTNSIINSPTNNATLLLRPITNTKQTTGEIA